MRGRRGGWRRMDTVLLQEGGGLNIEQVKYSWKGRSEPEKREASTKGQILYRIE